MRHLPAILVGARHLMRTAVRTRRPVPQIQHRPLPRIRARPRMHRLPRHPIPAGNRADHRTAEGAEMLPELRVSEMRYRAVQL